MKAFAKPYSGGVYDYNIARVMNERAAKTSSDLSERFMDIYIDNRRGDRNIVTNLEVYLEDLDRFGSQLAGSRGAFIEYLHGLTDEERHRQLTRAEEAEKREADLTDENDRLKAELEELKKAKALRVAGGAL